MFYPDLFLLNVCSLNSSSINQIENLVHNCNFGFICLTETHMNSVETDFKHIEGYTLISHFCRTVYHKGGVALFALNELNCLEITLNEFCVEKHFEICGLSCKNYKDKSVVVLVCYRSPDGDFNIFCENLMCVLDFIYVPGTNIILTGDFNIDASNNSRDAIDYRNLTALLSSFNLRQVVEWPTRVTSHSTTTIDHIYTNIYNPTVCVLDNTISDHRTILFECENRISPEKKEVPQRHRSFSFNNVSSFIHLIKEETWSDVYDFSNVDDAYNTFIGIFVHYFDRCFLLKRHYCVKDSDKLWVNNDVRKSSIKLKDLFLLKCRFPVLNEAYAMAKKQHELLLATTKRFYYQNKIFNANNPVKMAWKVVSDLTNRTRKHVLNNISISHENELVENPEAISNLFNDFFIDMPLKILSEHKPRNTVQLPEPEILGFSESLFLAPFSEFELLQLLTNKLKNKASSGPDEIPPFILKKVLCHIISPLTYLVNLSFTCGYFPSSLKIGKVIPVFKKQNPSYVENYRPVTVTSCFSKVFEYSFLQRLMGFTSSRGIFSDNQHGFLPGRSTQSAVLSFYEKLINSIESGACPVGIFCDLSRAFDCVQHNVLLSKLYRYGVRGVSLDWIRSFLASRKQFVSISSTKSSYRSVSMGVPQGSILGPILFLFYTNDMDNIDSSANFIRYADDTNILVSDKDENTLKQNCTTAVGKLVSWCDQNSLYFNGDKTSVIRFHNYQKQCETLTIVTDDISIKPTQSVKFLGITIDAGLNWKEHCTNLISKLNSLCYMFRNLKNILLREQLFVIYHAQVASRLRYGVCFWGVSTRAPDVFIAQKRILRIICDTSNKSSCRPLFRESKILTLISILILEMCLYVLANRNKYTRIQQIHDYNTRNCLNFHIPYCKYVVSSKSPDYLSLKIFNKLPKEIVSSANLTIFKTRLKKYLIENTFYTLDEFFTRSNI